MQAGPSSRSVSSGAPPRPPNAPHFPAVPTAAEEPLAAIGFEARHDHSGRHVERRQHVSRSWIDASQFALVVFPGAVPEIAIDPGDAGDEAVRFDRAKDRAGLRIDAMDLPLAIVPHPERSFGPGEARVAAAGGCRNRREHTAGPRVDLLDAILGDLVEVLAVEGRAGVSGD